MVPPDVLDEVEQESPPARHIRTLFPLVIVPGMVHVLAPASVNTVMRQLEFREHLGGLLQLVYFAGVLVGTIMITQMMQKLSVKRIITAMVFLLSASLLAGAAAPWYALLLFFFSVTGFANGVLITLPGVYVGQVCGPEVQTVQSMLYGFFSLGVVAGPVLPGLIARWQISYRWAMVGPAVLIIPFSLPFLMSKLVKLGKVDRLSVRVLREVLSFNRTLFLGLVIGIMFGAGTTSSVNAWLVRFLENVQGMAAGSAHWVLIAIGASVTIGRWTCSFLSRKVRPSSILSVVTVAGAAMVFIAPLPQVAVFSAILYPMAALLNSSVYPFMVGYSSLFPRADSSAVFTSMIAAASVGGAMLPYLIGILNQNVGPRFGMSFIAIFVVGLIICIYWIKPHLVESGSTLGDRPGEV